MLHHFNIALDNKVKPSELSEIITHLAFYSGWPNAMTNPPTVITSESSTRLLTQASAAVAIVKDLFEQRGIGTDQLPPVSPELLPLNEAAEADRAARVQ